MIVTDPFKFGQAIKKRRKELGYTQRYISEFTGFSISFISDLENGKSTAEKSYVPGKYAWAGYYDQQQG